MTDLSTTTEGKTDQINADMFIGGKTFTIKVTHVDVKLGAEQPVTIHYEGENGRPFKPCLSMRRVLIHVWGKDGNGYAGKSMTLYNDPKVNFGPVATGGVRISHVSGIDAPATIMLTEKRGVRKPFVIKPLVIENAPTKITRDQQKEIVAAMGTAVKPADLLAHFNIKTSGDILASQFAEVMEWVRGQQPATCEACGGVLTDGHCYNETCSNGEPPPEE